MWISTKYYQSPDDPSPVASRIKTDGDDLVIQNASSGEVIERWNFRALERSLEFGQSRVVFACPPATARIEIVDLLALGESSWAWRLPGTKGLSPRKRVALWMVGAAILLATLVIGFTTLLRSMPWGVERTLFGSRSVVATSQICQTPAGQAAGKKLFDRVYSQKSDGNSREISVTFIRGEAVNSFLFLGGKIYVYEGFLKQAQSPLEIAELLAHQIEHVRFGHVSQALTRDSLLVPFFRTLTANPKELDRPLLNLFMRLKFTPAEEREAQAAANVRLKTAGLDAGALQRFYDRARSQGTFSSFYSDHPEVTGSPVEFKEQVDPPLSVTEWAELQQICAATRSP